MADYITVREPEPDPWTPAVEYAVTTMRDSMPLIALPERRLELGRAADWLDRLLREKAGT